MSALSATITRQSLFCISSVSSSSSEGGRTSDRLSLDLDLDRSLAQPIVSFLPLFFCLGRLLLLLSSSSESYLSGGGTVIAACGSSSLGGGGAPYSKVVDSLGEMGSSFSKSDSC